MQFADRASEQQIKPVGTLFKQKCHSTQRFSIIAL
jgi:hypothetical protein